MDDSVFDRKSYNLDTIVPLGCLYGTFMKGALHVNRSPFTTACLCDMHVL